MSKATSSKSRSKAVVISFRVTEETYKQLEELAAEQKDDAGQTLNAASFSRRIVANYLNQSEASGRLSRKSRR